MGNDAGRFIGIAGQFNFYGGGVDTDRKLLAVLSGTITITPTRSYFYRCDTLLAPADITLNSESAYDGMEIVFKKIGGVFPATITCSGKSDGAKIDGQTSRIITDPFEALHLWFDYDQITWWTM